MIARKFQSFTFFTRMVLFILLLSSFNSCKKDKLEGDKILLEGKWRWVETKFYNPYSNPQQISVYPQPDHWVTIEFLKKGKIDLEYNEYNHYYNEPKKRITFEEFREDANTGTYHFAITVRQANYFNTISGILRHSVKDTLIIDDIPVTDTLQSVFNYFVRE